MNAQAGWLRLLPAGGDALLAEVGSVEEALEVYAAAREVGLVVTDLVPAARTVLFDGFRDRDAVVSFLEGMVLGGRGAGGSPGPVVQVPTAYDGEDLPDVARLWGMTTDEVVRTHSGTEFVVAFCGFAPGFAYCTGLPAVLAVPRLNRPRARVPAGSVAVAGEFTGVYPTASPGGWRLLGRTDLTLWDASREPPATLVPGTRVRFVPVRR